LLFFFIGLPNVSTLSALSILSVSVPHVKYISWNRGNSHRGFACQLFRCPPFLLVVYVIFCVVFIGLKWVLPIQSGFCELSCDFVLFFFVSNNCYVYWLVCVVTVPSMTALKKKVLKIRKRWLETTNYYTSNQYT
jgi:hypothetical protein